MSAVSTIYIYTSEKYTVKKVMLSTYIVQVCLHLEVLQSFLNERYECTSRNAISIDIAFVQPSLVSKHKCRVRETWPRTEVLSLAN